MSRINILLKLKGELYHTGDLALIWGIKNNNTLYTTIKRYVKNGILIPIHKGYYSTIPLIQINPFNLAAGYLHRFVYVSCEYILTKADIIFQKGNYFTLISDVSKRFTIGGNSFWVRKLKDKYLFNNCGIMENNGVNWASVERAVADLLYFNPNYYFDNRSRINWRKVKEVQEGVGYR